MRGFWINLFWKENMFGSGKNYFLSNLIYARKSNAHIFDKIYNFLVLAVGKILQCKKMTHKQSSKLSGFFFFNVSGFCLSFQIFLISQFFPEKFFKTFFPLSFCICLRKFFFPFQKKMKEFKQNFLLKFLKSKTSHLKIRSQSIMKLPEKPLYSWKIPRKKILGEFVWIFIPNFAVDLP